MRKPRHLSPEERALWDHITRQATPMHDMRHKKATDGPVIKASNLAARLDAKSRAKHPVKANGHGHIGAPAIVPHPMAQFRIGEAADKRHKPHSLMSPIHHQLAAQPVRMDAKAHKTMRRGKLKPEGRIDLHGMTMDQAHPALTGFIMASFSQGRRLVLVITGKGKLRDELAPMPVRKGLLRHQVPQWLSIAPLGPIVLQVTPAHIRHGGDGAYYVYLRRR